MVLDDWKTTADIVKAAVTSLAVIAGGSWAYFRFVKGRTFRPHVEAEIIGATWLGTQDRPGRLHVRVQLKNIGAAKVALTQRGTAVKVSRIAEKQLDPPAAMQWNDFDKEYEIFCAHEWIEPGETIADEVLLRLPIEPQVIQVRTRIVLARKLRSNISVVALRIFTPTSNDEGTNTSNNGGTETPALPTS